MNHPPGNNPYAYKPQNPNYHRRAWHHDYHRPARYMITINKNDSTPRLSEVCGNPARQAFATTDAPHVELTRYGRFVAEGLEEWLQKFPQIWLANYIIMPDHVHLCIEVIGYLKCGLSTAIASLMGGATRARNRFLASLRSGAAPGAGGEPSLRPAGEPSLRPVGEPSLRPVGEPSLRSGHHPERSGSWPEQSEGQGEGQKERQSEEQSERQSEEQSERQSERQSEERSERRGERQSEGQPGGELGPFFSKGFNDRIAYDDTQWMRQQKYVDDNPRRYLIKRMHPDFYFTRWKITCGGREYVAVGNIMLLKNPDLQVVRFSRKYAPGVFEQLTEGWRRCVRNAGVLVSPFIHPKEAEMKREALEAGGSVIRICEQRYIRRMNPQGNEFEYLSTGRLLLITPAEYDIRREDMSRNKAMEMNKYAEIIAATEWLSGEGSITKA